MDFFEKNNFTGNGVITLDRLTPDENKFSLLFRDNDNRIVGFGFYNNSLNENKYTGGSWMQYFFDKFNDENYREITKRKIAFLFIVADNHFYYCDLNVINPIAPKTESIAKFSEFANELVELGIKQEEQHKLWEEERQAEKENNDPLKTHMQRVVERLERIAGSTRGDSGGWNYLEIPLHKIESDISTLTGWMTSGMDGHRMEIYNNLCEEYDCKLFE